MISCILMRYSLSNNLLYMLNYTFSYNKIICIFVLIARLYLFRNLLSYHRALSLPTSNLPRRSEAARYDTFSIELHSYLNPRKSFTRVPILSVYEFGLNTIQNTRNRGCRE